MVEQSLERDGKGHKGFYIGGLLMLVLAGILVYANSFVPLKPVLFSNGYKTVKLSQKSYQNLKLVLTFYGVDYKEKHGAIYVRRQLLRDQEMICNYTRKAIDERWLRAHLTKL